MSGLVGRCYCGAMIKEWMGQVIPHDCPVRPAAKPRNIADRLVGAAAKPVKRDEPAPEGLSWGRIADNPLTVLALLLALVCMWLVGII